MRLVGIMDIRIVICFTLVITAVSCHKHQNSGISVKDDILMKVQDLINGFADKQIRLAPLFERIADAQRQSVDKLFTGTNNLWNDGLSKDEYGIGELNQDVIPPPLPPAPKRHRRRHRGSDDTKTRSDNRHRPIKRPRLSRSYQQTRGSQNDYTANSNYPRSARNNNGNNNLSETQTRLRTTEAKVDDATLDDKLDLVEPAKKSHSKLRHLFA